MTDLLEEAVKAAGKAYAPYSNYQVGCAIRTDTGEMYTGCNVENASYGLTNCAERTAVFKGVSDRGGMNFSIVEVAIAAFGERPPNPCGACRQVLIEFAADDCQIVVAPAEDLEQARTYRLDELLPYNF